MNGLLLAGGQSLRMGQDKRFLPFAGVPMLLYVAKKMKKFCRAVSVIVEDKEKFAWLEKEAGVRVLQDIFPSTKALGAIYTGLVHSRSTWNFVQACDTPFVPERAMRFLRSFARGCDWVIPQYAGRLHPLCSWISRRALPAVQEALQAKDLRVLNLMEKIPTRVITEVELRKCRAPEQMFWNINTPTDYALAFASIGDHHALRA